MVLRDYQLHGGYTPGPLLAVAALAGLAGSCMLGAGGRGRERAATATACLLTTATAIILLLASDVYEF